MLRNAKAGPKIAYNVCQEIPRQSEYVPPSLRLPTVRPQQPFPGRCFETLLSTTDCNYPLAHLFTESEYR